MKIKQKEIGRPIRNKSIGKLDKRINILTKKELFDKFKEKAKEKGKSANGLINDLIVLQVKGKPRKKRVKKKVEKKKTFFQKLIKKVRNE